MGGYLTRRLASMAVSLVGITVVVFLLLIQAPGDPVTIRTGVQRQVPEAVLQEIRRDLGLDLPLPAQYLRWLSRVSRLDLGTSIAHRRPVATVAVEKLPATLLLNGLALFIALIIAIPLGVVSASRPGSWFDRLSGGVLFALYSLPTFWVALILIEVFAIRLEVLPLFGMESARAETWGAGARFIDRLFHLVLPVTVLAYAQLAFFARFIRSSLREVLSADYIVTARAKGASPRRVLWAHAGRNALLPLISLAGLMVPWIISGSVIVEQIFQWDGIGRLFFSAVLMRDYPLVMGLTLIVALITMAGSLAADLIYSAADPRVRLGSGQ